MQVKYMVAGITRTTRHGIAMVNGESMGVVIPETEVELVDETGEHGSVMFHFRRPSEIEYAWATYRPGEMVAITLPDAPVIEAPVEAEAEAEVTTDATAAA